MPTATFFYRFCPNGHGLYEREHPPESTHCGRCGEMLLETCEHCDARITFSAIRLYKNSDGEPYFQPRFPKFCTGCGAKYPWIERSHENIEATGIWILVHPKVIELAKCRYESCHYADAVEAVFKELNAIIKRRWVKSGGQETDGADLMRKVFRPKEPLIKLGDLDSETGRNIQQGYMEIFAGSMAGLRNPNAHANINISPERAMHQLMLGSLLFYVLEDGREDVAE